MLFNSYAFLFCFLPVALAGYALAVRHAGRAGAQCWLILSSFVFYGWWSAAEVPLLAASVLVNALALRVVGGRFGGLAAAAGVAANLGLLAWFKYLPAGWSGGPALPLGISFFTFTQIGLLLDARHDPAIRPGLREHALFVTFFPHLIAGPLLHHSEMLPQLRRLGRLSAVDASAGLAIFAVGLAKKTLLADRLAPAAVAGYAHPGALGAAGAWAAALAYSMQLYFDFSGYSDMAIGLARLFGVRFPANFASPYQARSIIEYWQRWHITLTRYLNQYLYTPMALAAGRWCARRGWRSRGRPGPAGFAVRVAGPVGATMALAGIWHGSGPTFLAFGLLHALFLVVNHAWRLYGPRRRGGRLAAAWQLPLTYACALAGSVLFRADTLGHAGALLAALAGLHGPGLPDADLETARTWALILGAAAIAFLAPNTQQIMARCEPVLGAVVGEATRWQWQPSLRWAAAVGCLGALGLLAIGQPAEFLYFQF